MPESTPPLHAATPDVVCFWPSPRARVRQLIKDTSGTVYVEYVTLLVLVSLVLSASIAAVGAPMVNTYRYSQYVLAAPLP